MTTQLLNIQDLVKEVPQSLGEQIVGAFTPYLSQITPLLAEARTINVTSEAQVEDMARARSTRLALVKIKSDVEANRKTIKDPYLRASNAVDAVGIRLRNELDVVIKQLKTHEDFAKLEQEKRQLELASKRRQELSKVEADIATQELDLGALSETAYQMILKSATAEYEAKLAAKKEAELQRIEAEKARIAEEQRLRAENERLMAERQKEQAALEKERVEQQKKLDAERKAREVAEAKLKAEKEAKQRAEDAERARLASEQKAREEAQRQALLAPDKTKLLDLAKQLDDFKLPAVSSREASAVIRATEEMIGKMTNYIRERAKAL